MKINKTINDNENLTIAPDLKLRSLSSFFHWITDLLDHLNS